MSFLRFFSPMRAYADLRLFLSRRQPHQVVFLAAAIAITAFFVSLISRDADYTPPYEPHIIYVQQWRLDRTDAEIHAQQKIDEVALDKRRAEVRGLEEKRRQQFKQVDDALKKYGI